MTPRVVAPASSDLPLWALVRKGEVMRTMRRAERDDLPEPAEMPARARLDEAARWLPVTEQVGDHDPDLHRLAAPTFTVESDRVVADYAVKPAAPRLTADRDEMPDDGATPATLTYYHVDGPAEVVFHVAGVAETVALTGGRAVIEVVANQPGDVAVHVTGPGVPTGDTDAGAESTDPTPALTLQVVPA